MADNGPGLPAGTIDGILDFSARVSSREAYLVLSVNSFRERTKTEATDAAWPKWLPSAPTPAHWYGSDELERLACAYIAYDRELARDWDAVYDARGHFTEPHTRKIVGLGTLDVRAYPRDIETHMAVAKISDNYPTRGPEDRFGAVRFIEKEGFLPLLAAVNLAERYDVAIMSTKGMPVVACLHLADELCGRHHIPLLVLHDFDKSGLSIYSNLAGEAGKYRNFQRYQYRHEFQTIDLGLRLADVKKYGLDSEVVAYRSDPKPNLARSGATPAEIAFLSSEGPWQKHVGRRVELNAFTSPAFVTWIEAKLTKHGVKKVVPDDKTVEVAYRRAMQIEMVREQLPAIIQASDVAAEQTALPKNLTRIIRKELKTVPDQAWDQAVAVIAAANCKKRSTRKGNSACPKSTTEGDE